MTVHNKQVYRLNFCFFFIYDSSRLMKNAFKKITKIHFICYRKFPSVKNFCVTDLGFLLAMVPGVLIWYQKVYTVEENLTF